MNITPLQDSFNRGELAPKLYGRSDSEFYLDGVKVLQNFLPIARGAVERRRGFRYLGAVALPSTDKNVFPVTAGVEITTPTVEVVSA